MDDYRYMRRKLVRLAGNAVGPIEDYYRLYRFLSRLRSSWRKSGENDGRSIEKAIMTFLLWSTLRINNSIGASPSFLLYGTQLTTCVLNRPGLKQIGLIWFRYILRNICYIPFRYHEFVYDTLFSFCQNSDFSVFPSSSIGWPTSSANFKTSLYMAPKPNTLIFWLFCENTGIWCELQCLLELPCL